MGTKTYGCFAGTHIDYNLSRQLLQCLLSFNLINFWFKLTFVKKRNETLKSSTKTYGCFAGTHIDYNLSRQLLQYFVPIVEQGISHIFNKNEVFEVNMQISS